MTVGLLFAGDPHGCFDAINAALARDTHDAAILLGDLCPTVSLEQAVTNGQTPLWWIRGNHDCDKDDWYRHSFDSALAEREITGRVIDVGGVRIAGLGGVFRGKTWYPPDAPAHATREGFLKTMGKGNRWRGGLPRKLRCSIWHEDYARLAGLQADVLVTHEAPSCHRNGFAAIDELAGKMGVRLIVHGHHHEDYEGRVGQGIRVIGVGQACVTKVSLNAGRAT